MGYRAIALSQVDGTGGEQVGRVLADKLAFEYLNEAVVAQVARDYGVGTTTVSEAERRKSFLTRIADMGALGAMAGVASDSSAYAFDDTDTILAWIREAVRQTAARGNVVLVAHAASYACADQADVLRVSLTAPLQTRISRLAAARQVDEKEAAKLLRRSDAARASYLKRVYKMDEESPTDYDLVINMERLDPETVAEIVLALVGSADTASPMPSSD